MKEVRMEYTAGLGKTAEVWVDGALLTVCDGISEPEKRTPPGELERVMFRYTTDESVSWDQAIADNPGRHISLNQIAGWRYEGFGLVESVMPVVINFGGIRMEDPNWSTDENLVGKYVCVPIDRLEIVPRVKPDWPDEMK